MPDIKIDSDLCNKDGLCAMVCTYAIFRQDEKGTVPTIDEYMRPKCYRCGHCVAICPSGAVSHSDFSKEDVSPIRSEFVPTYDHVLELMRLRRSKRLFKDRPVEKEVLEKVLEAARLSPSQHNDQSTDFVIIQDRKIIHEITVLTAEGITKLVEYTKNPIARFMMRRAIGRRGVETLTKIAPEMEGLVSLFKSGTDWILRDAPVLMLFCADSAGGTFASVNANIALHSATLAAESLGLGSFYAGFVVMSCERDDRIEKLVGLPDTHKIYGALALGYPLLHFKKWPERNPAKAIWLGF
jgi:nitroreductase/NAD-dependent dihydropyrimidine dehydrogenase PreA subunit